MNYLNGGYVMLDKADSDIFAKASGALQAGKPILWYEDKNTCYFIDTIEKTGSDSIALTKGGLTIVITSGNVVTEVGSVQQHLYSNNVYIIGEDENTNNCYIYLTILAPKALTNTEIEDYIKEFTDTSTLAVSGYGDSHSIEIVSYNESTEKYRYTNSNDEENTFEIDTMTNKVTQIF